MGDQVKITDLQTKRIDAYNIGWGRYGSTNLDVDKEQIFQNCNLQKLKNSSSGFFKCTKQLDLSAGVLGLSGFLEFRANTIAFMNNDLALSTPVSVELEGFPNYGTFKFKRAGIDCLYYENVDGTYLQISTTQIKVGTRIFDPLKMAAYLFG